MEESLLLSGSARVREPADSDLVVLAQRGDTEALGALYDQHYLAIYRYLRARVGDPQLAEDMAGDVFRRMLTGLSQYRPAGLPFGAWLFRIAHNLLVDHYRQEDRRMSVGLHETDHQAKSGEDPAAIVEGQLTLEQACRALAELDAPLRDVLELRFLGGLSLREAALALNRTEDSVKALQRRGLAALRFSLSQQ